MKAAEGILTELGGMTSHAAVVARGMGVCAITACSDSDRLRCRRSPRRMMVVIKRGDVITLDGTAGEAGSGIF